MKFSYSIIRIKNILNQLYHSPNQKCHYINPCHCNSKSNTKTECKTKVIYELNLKKNQSMLYQNLSQEIERTEPSKKYIPRYQNILYKSNSTRFSRKNGPYNNKDKIKNFYLFIYFIIYLKYLFLACI